MVFEVVQHRPNATLSEGGWGLARSGHIDQLKGLYVIYVGAEFSLTRFYECSTHTTICMCVLRSFSGCIYIMQTCIGTQQSCLSTALFI